jgi:hypothetical protein
MSFQELTKALSRCECSGLSDVFVYSLKGNQGFVSLSYTATDEGYVTGYFHCDVVELD